LTRPQAVPEGLNSCPPEPISCGFVELLTCQERGAGGRKLRDRSFRVAIGSQGAVQFFAPTGSRRPL
jgi:hypothetical protein